MQKIFLLTGSILGGLGIAIGAFGAHALKKTLLANDKLEVFETAVKYHFYHAFALLIAGILIEKIQSPLMNFAGYAFIIGVMIFSGSLYILSISGVTKWGAVTPIGGLILIIGWILMFIGILKNL